MTEENKKEASKKKGVKYGGFWIRLVAIIVDSIIITLASKILFGDRVVTVTGGTLQANFTGIYFFIPVLYSILFWKFKQATPGKMLMGLKIIPSDDSKQLEWKHVILRYVGYFVSGFVFMLGFIWIGFDKKKQGWHDKIAKTTVVKK